MGLKDKKLRNKLMAKGDITLTEALAEAAAAETAEQPEDQTEGRTTPTRHLRRGTSTHQGEIESPLSTDSEEGETHRLQSVRESRGRKSRFPCAGCGGDHYRSECRFLKAFCRLCDKKGHIARVCRNRRQHSPKRRDQTPNRRVPTSPRFKERQPENRLKQEGRHKYEPDRRRREETHQTFTVGHSTTRDAKKVYATVQIENSPCVMEVDSGSFLSMISWNTLRELIPSIKLEELEKQTLILKDYQGNRIPVVGRGHFQVKFKDHHKKLPLTIVGRDRPSLLGLQWFEPLGIEVTGINLTEISEWENSIVEEFQEVFDNKLGKYKGSPITFNLNPKIQPIRLKPRRVPFALKHKIDEQLDKLIAQGVLEPVDHAQWETPIVTPIKPDGSLRICGDYKATLNHALQQSAYPVPVVQHLLHSLGGGRVFAKLDLAQAYQQLPVDKKTAEAQTIVTHRGAFRCNRLQFGVSVAPGVFQSLMERLLQGIEGVVPYFDDVLIAARDDKQLQSRLRRVLEKFRDAGLKVKKEKCQLRTEQVEFLGYLIDKSGIHPTEKKLKAIREAPRPKTKTELQAFLGLLNFYNVFLYQKATVAEPLHRLLDKKTQWCWGRREENAFNNVKQLITSDAVLMQFNETLPVVLTCDASPFGIGAILSHQLPDGREAPIAFSSRTLSKPERNYSQLDKEALAIVAGVKKFHEYLYGRRFKIITDHKPLLGILAGDRATPIILSPRMSRWSEFLAAYSYQLIHRPGKLISHADALSRAPLPETEEDPAPSIDILQVETFVNSTLTADDISWKTQKDPILSRVLSWVKKGWPDKLTEDVFRPFKIRQTELFTDKGCILWGDRVLIPAPLQARVLETLHEGHPGIVKMKGLARSYVWWPGIDKQIEHWVARCKTCQEISTNPPAAPVQEWEKAKGPWSRIHIDFAGPTNGYTFLIIVDAYSNWLEVCNMKSTVSEAVIEKLSRLFATHGLPDILVSDNGPQFTALSFEQFLANLGIRHALTAPSNPAANGRAERMVQYTKKVLHKLGPGNIDEKLNKLLLIQHITPGKQLNRCPAELLMGRKLRTVLDRMNPTYSPETPPGSTSRVRQFKVGDPVYARNLTGVPLWIPAEITQVTGPLSYRLQTSDGRQLKRHINQLRSRLTNYEETEQGTRRGGETVDTEDDEIIELYDNLNPEGDKPLNRRCSLSPESGNSEEPSPGRRRRTDRRLSGESLMGSRSPSPVMPSGSNLRGDRPEGIGSPAETTGEQSDPSRHNDMPARGEMRRLTRRVRSPAYLRDYIVSYRRTNPRGEGCNVSGI